MCLRCHTLGRVAGLVFVTLAAAILPLASAESVEVRDIRIGIHPDSTRFVLDMSGEVQPRIFGLPDPYRVVIVRGGRLTIKLSQLKSTPSNYHLGASIRVQGRRIERSPLFTQLT